LIALGLDPSLTGFGWCVHDSEAIDTGRVIAKGHEATSTKSIFVTRYMALREMVVGLTKTYPLIKAVGVESPPFGELWSEGLYGLFLYVNEALYTTRKDVVFFDPATVKMLTKQDPSKIKGKMCKSDMVAAARADTGIKGKFNHNEADAYHIAKFAARFWEFQSGLLTEEDLTPSEMRSFARTHTYTRGEKAGKTVKSGTVYRENDRFFRYSTLPQ
jgi:hypothetical protein